MIPDDPDAARLLFEVVRVFEQRLALSPVSTSVSWRFEVPEKFQLDLFSASDGGVDMQLWGDDQEGRWRLVSGRRISGGSPLMRACRALQLNTLHDPEHQISAILGTISVLLNAVDEGAR